MAAKVVARFAGFVVYEEAEAVVFTCAEKEEACRLRKPPLQVEQPNPSRWPEGFFDSLKTDLKDLLAEQALAAGEPSFASVAALLPPLRDLAFLGDMASAERLEVTPEGAVVGREDLPPPPEGALLSVGLLDGWLPALVHCYSTDAGPVELLQLATVGESGTLDLWRRVKRGTGFGATFVYMCNAAETSAEHFYGRLLALWQEWEQLTSEGLRVTIPEPEVATAARGMLVLGLLTFRGVQPRYGVGWYDLPEHNSFPPAVLFLVQSLLAWGRLDPARELLSHYLSRFVKEDGTLDYYGPAVAEYGQLLALIAEYVRTADDLPWLARRLTLLRPLWQRLLTLRQKSLARYPEGDVHRGLIPGLPEADYHDQAQEWDTFYYSGDVWAARGLRDMGLALQGLAQPGLHREGADLIAEAEAYRADIVASITAAMAGNAEYVPPGPDQTAPIEDFTADRHEWYCNYRYLPEMLSAGVLPAELVTKVASWRRTHGGEILANTRFRDTMDNWPALHYARGLLETDDLDHYLLLLYSHWAHSCSQGTLSSYEQVHIEPDETGTRRLRAGQVVPCQVMMPTMLRWALIYEERDADTLWLCRAIPRRWLASGEKIKTNRVPTRFGKVGFAVRMTSDSTAEVDLRLPQKGLPAEINLRLRHPRGNPAQAAIGDETVPIEEDILHLPRGLKGKVRVEVRWEAS
jgi:hypothetical protein